jgi:hypothetical protein
MVQGIETGDKKYKHKKKDDVKWLAKDLNEIRKTAENYIDSKRPKNDEELNVTVKRGMSETWSFIRIIAIILGIIGFFSLLFGIYLLFIIQGNFVIGITGCLIGLVFLLTFILFEKY